MSIQNEILRTTASIIATSDAGTADADAYDLLQSLLRTREGDWSRSGPASAAFDQLRRARKLASKNAKSSKSVPTAHRLWSRAAHHLELAEFRASRLLKFAVPA